MNRRSRIAAALVLAFAGLTMYERQRTATKPTAPPATTPAPESYTATSLSLGVGTGTRIVKGAEVSPAFFPAAEAPLVVGRMLAPTDFEPGTVAVAVLNEQFWIDVLKADRSLVGHKLLIGSDSVTVVGIIGKGFDFPSGTGIWMAKRTRP